MPPAEDARSEAGGNVFAPEEAAREPSEAKAAPGMLYVVSTPIGSMEDISARALQTLREVSLILAEDARITRRLLHHYAIENDVLSVRPRRDSDPEALALARLREGNDVALVVDAGTPAIADPGAKVVSAAIDRGFHVVPVPGPVAAIAALVVSGLPTGRFVFEGFPPRARADRQAFFAALAQETRTLVLYESPAYLLDTLETLAVACGGERQAALACNLTKPNERILRGSLSALLSDLRRKKLTGEFVLIAQGRKEP